MTNEIAEIEYVDTSFKAHEFMHSVFDVNIKFEIIKMKDSVFIYIGNVANPLLSDMSYGVQTRYESHPIATKILGTASSDTSSLMIAKRLTKRLKKPVYISFNLPVTHDKLLEEIETRLVEEIELNSDLF